jgi:large subunit ribosomal protein L2
MGKNITSQKRGRGSPTYTRPSFNFKGQSSIGTDGHAKIVDFIACRAHSAPLARIVHEDGSNTLTIAPEGVCVGQEIMIGASEKKEIIIGNVLKLAEIPEGTSVFNIENIPGDGGKFVKASGVGAKIISKTGSKVTILLPSKKSREFNPDCRACIGNVAGSGRPEKPFYKAGRKFHRMKAKNIYYPIVSGVSMNAVAHPFGGRSSHHKGRPTMSKKNSPPGRNVGAIRPRRTGYKR